MTITSLEFVAFSLVVFVLYYLVPSRAQNSILLGASYLFLISWEIQFAAVFLFLTLANFVLARYVERDDRAGKLALRIGITINVLALAFFKYSDFFIPSADEALNTLGVRSATGAINILLPVGLSFFVVQAISYLLDVRRKLFPPILDLIEFAVYMAYFPRVISGPIERARDFIPRLQQRRLIKDIAVDESITLILQGLVRKLVIADLLFLIMPVDIFDTPQSFSSPELAIWLLAYAFALYNDFAGYTSIIRGVSGFFCIPLAKNFNVPYLARSFSEFWQSWHITLSNWLRDYIYTPTTRSLLRRNFAPRHLLVIAAPPLLTMFVSALWHDASLNMLLWGGMHGLFLVVERLVMLNTPRKPFTAQNFLRQAANIALVFTLTLLAWVPFRADLSSTRAYWAGLFSPSGWVNSLTDPDILNRYIVNRVTVDVMILICFSLIIDFTQKRWGEYAIHRLPVPFRAVVINALVFSLFVAVIATQEVPPPFVYQGF